MFNEFRMIKITLELFYKKVSRKPCINIEIRIRRLKFSYTAMVVTRTMKFLAVETPLAIYHGCPTTTSKYS